MLLRTLYVRGGMLGLDLSKLLCLPFKVVEESLGFLKHEKCTEVLGGDLIGRIMDSFSRRHPLSAAAVQLKHARSRSALRRR